MAVGKGEGRRGSPISGSIKAATIAMRISESAVVESALSKRDAIRYCPGLGGFATVRFWSEGLRSED